MVNKDPFVAFRPAEPVVEAKPEIKRTKKMRKLHERSERKVKQIRERKPTKTKWEHVDRPLPNEGVMVPLSVIAAMRSLTDDEIKFTIAMANGIAELSKLAQKHVVAALAKIFS